MGKYKRIKVLEIDASAVDANTESEAIALQVGEDAADSVAIYVEALSITGGAVGSQVNLFPRACADKQKNGNNPMNCYSGYDSSVAGISTVIVSGVDPGTAKIVIPVGRTSGEARVLPPFMFIKLPLTSTAYSSGTFRVTITLQ